MSWQRTRIAALGRYWLACVAATAGMLISPDTRAGGPDFGPSAAEIRAAQKAARAFRRPRGIARAMRALCRDIDTPQHHAAFAVLIERADKALPRLLDTMVAHDRAGENDIDAVPTCGEQAPRVIHAAICEGTHDADTYDVEWRSRAAIAKGRSAAQRAFLELLAKPHSRQRAALDVMTGLAACVEYGIREDLIKRATPSLVTMLSAKETVDAALQVLAMGGADRNVALPALRPMLKDISTLPLAATALAHLGEDMSNEVPRLAELLRGQEPIRALKAIEVIGAKARGALPQIAALAGRLDESCQKPVQSQQIITALGRVATTEDDYDSAIKTLVALFRCGPVTSVSEKLVYLGSDGQEAVLDFVRDDDQTIQRRLDAWWPLGRIKYALDDDDQEVLKRLRAKQDSSAEPQTQILDPTPPPPPLALATEALNACRAEADESPVELEAIPDDQARTFAYCLRWYLCGPSSKTLERTLSRCCIRAFGDSTRPFCED